ncbi:hypothetical protein RIR_jg14984.t1 [Rhizophagus irregularis DAOM 181602=DAOM 197198]|nr:hypothetical protein RIR_jg14984.t1 [Rhizophagus irregularis DAOM 181602=DAOM 197198]
MIFLDVKCFFRCGIPMRRDALETETVRIRVAIFIKAKTLNTFNMIKSIYTQINKMNIEYTIESYQKNGFKMN